jgi:hypothetical protein
MAEYTDQQITRMAKARVAFKMHALVYAAVNLFLFAIWLITRSNEGVDVQAGQPDGGYWPIWTHLGWGLGLAIHGFTTYGPASNMLQREEDKLRQELGKT